MAMNIRIHGGRERWRGEAIANQLEHDYID